MSTLHITAAGLVTALGLDTDTTIASLRTNLDAFRRVPIAGASGKDLQAAPISGFAEGTSGLDRYEALAERALRACLVDIDDAEREQMVVFLGLPRADRPGVPEGLAEILPQRLASILGLRPSAIVPLSLGRAAAYGGMTKARAALQDSRITRCVVGGVDVLTNSNSLRGLSRARLLKEDWDGFIPGEAAAFVRVQSQRAHGLWSATGAQISGLGAAKESAVGTAADPLTGKAVCSTMRAACREAQAADSDMHLHINDVNGSRAAFEDNAMGRVRFFRAPKHHYEVWHIASWLGETGAACGGIQLAWAAAALELGIAPGRGILLSASDAEIRTAAVLQRPTSAFENSLPKRRISRACAAVQPYLSSSPPDAAPVRGLHQPSDDFTGDLCARHHQELAWLWRMREQHLRLGESAWAGIEGYENRLLGHLDALTWAGLRSRDRAIAALQSDDPDELAAAMLVLLSFPLESRSITPVTEHAVRSELHLSVLTRVVPHLSPEISQPLLTRMAASPESKFCQAGLRGMAARLWADPTVLRTQLASRDAETVALAIQLAGSIGITELADHAAALASRDDIVIRGGLTKVALLSLGLPASTAPSMHATSLVREAPIAAAFLCLKEGLSFIGVLREGGMTVATIDACGWSGEVATAPQLLQLLETTNEQHQLAAARALTRIYGPNPQPLSRAAWEQHLEQASLPVSGTARLRHGTAWSRESAVKHLRRPECGFAERLMASWEHAVIHQRGLPLHPGQFVATQRQGLNAAGGLVG